jgi:hypothetical protein
VTRQERQIARLALGPAALLTVAQAAELMPWGDSRCRAWLRDHGLVRHDPELGEAVVWGDVLAAYGAHPAPEEPASPRPPSGLPRRTLRADRG